MFSRLLQNNVCVCVCFIFLFASAASSIYAICIVNVAHLNGVIVFSSEIAFDFSFASSRSRFPKS